jgi:hypothetical protein
VPKPSVNKIPHLKGIPLKKKIGPKFENVSKNNSPLNILHAWYAGYLSLTETNVTHRKLIFQALSKIKFP